MHKENLVAFELYGHELWHPPVPAPRTRTWMDQIPGKNAYRCLPLMMANHGGWFILCPTTLRITWDGTALASAMKIEAEEEIFLDKYSLDEQGQRKLKVRGSITSHFGAGVLTFALPWMFRTQVPGIGLRVEGPTNLWVPGLQPLTAFVETWGHVSTFTMNWKVWSPHQEIIIPKNFPICMVSLHDFRIHDQFDPLIGPRTLMPDEVDLELTRWQQSREAVLHGQPNPYGFDDQKVMYTRAKNVDGSFATDVHWTKVNVPHFIPVQPIEPEG